MMIRFLISVLIVLAACDSQDEHKARQQEELQRMVREAAAKVREEEEARLAAERNAMDEERARLQRFDTLMAARRLVQQGLAHEPEPATTCERIIGGVSATSLRLDENHLERLGRTCKAADAQARACLAHVVDAVDREPGLTEHLAALMSACMKHEPEAFTLPE